MLRVLQWGRYQEVGYTEEKSRVAMYSTIPIISIVESQHDGRTWVGIAGDPRTMNGKHHQQHQYGNNYNALQVRSNTIAGFMCIIMLRSVLQFASLKSDTNNICTKFRMFFFSGQKWVAPPFRPNYSWTLVQTSSRRQSKKAPLLDKLHPAESCVFAQFSCLNLNLKCESFNNNHYLII